MSQEAEQQMSQGQNSRSKYLGEIFEEKHIGVSRRGIFKEFERQIRISRLTTPGKQIFKRRSPPDASVVMRLKLNNGLKVQSFYGQIPSSLKRFKFLLMGTTLKYSFPLKIRLL